MIDLLLFAFALAAICFAGLLVVQCLGAGERAGSLLLAFPFGLIALTAALCAMSLLGVTAGPQALWLVATLLPLAALRRRWTGWKRERGSSQRPRLDPVVVVLGAGLLALLALVVLDALARPFAGGDTMGLWAVKASIIRHEGLIDFARIDFPDNHSLGYPPLIPVAEAFLGAILGVVTHDLVRLLFPFFAALAVGFAWYGLGSGHSARTRLGAVLLLLATPFVASSTSSGMADVPLLAFSLGAFAWLPRWLARGDIRGLEVALLLAAGASLVRLEGTLLFASLVLVAALFAPGGWPARLRAILSGLVVFALSNGPWFWLRAREGYTSYPERPYPVEVWTPWVDLPQAWERVRVILDGFGHEVVHLERWSLVWILFAVLVLLHIRGLLSRVNGALGLLFALYLGAHFGAMYFNPLSVAEIHYLTVTYLPRALLHLLPAAAVLALHLAVPARGGLAAGADATIRAGTGAPPRS